MNNSFVCRLSGEIRIIKNIRQHHQLREVLSGSQKIETFFMEKLA